MKAISRTDLAKVLGWVAVWTALMAALMTLAVGCATGPGKPPRRVETSLYDITTNVVEVVTWQTNQVVITNTVGQTTGVAHVVLPITNFIPSYSYTPNSNAVVIQESGKRIGGLFGVGELVGAVVGLGLGVYGTMRCTKSAVSKANTVAGALAQTIETLRVVLRATPQGSRVEDEIVKWMIKNQNSLGVLAEVNKILSTVVDTSTAEAASKEILAKATSMR